VLTVAPAFSILVRATRSGRLLMALPCGLTPPEAACLASSITLACRKLMIMDHSHIQSSTCSLFHSFKHLFMYSLFHSFKHLLICSLFNSSKHLLDHSLTHLLFIQGFIHSFLHSFFTRLLFSCLWFIRASIHTGSLPKVRYAQS